VSHEPLRRRDNAGCEQNFPGWDYTEEEREFLAALDRYKRTRRRPHPTWCEVLNVLRELGWRKQTPTTSAGGN
jgi:hypothetical protein